MSNNKGLIFTISGPSGAGKDTIAQHLIETFGDIGYVPTATTRPPRDGEEHGVHYYFLSKEDFLERVKNEDFVEWINNNYGNYYGTLKNVIDDELKTGRHIISDITIHGVRAMKEFKPENTVSLFIIPPSFEALEKRLRARQEETKEDNAALELRLEMIRGRLQEDLERMHEEDYKLQIPDVDGASIEEFEHVIVNDNLEDTLKKAVEIVAAERQKRS